MRFSLRSVSVLLLVTMFAALFAFGQAETGTITGTVTDRSGAVVPGAKITVKSTASGYTRTASASGTGNFAIPSLQPGRYEVRVESAGFGAFTRQVEVTVGSRVTVNPALTAGTSEITIDVVENDAGVAVNTTNQTVGQTISAQSITELPTITRNPYSLAATAGNVASDPGGASGRGVGVSINGQRSASTSILLDGGENVDNFSATTGQNVALDSVQEFSVLTNNFTPEFGRASGGIVNVATKSGTNSFHGSAYEFYRGSGLGANTPENKANQALETPSRNQRDRYDRNQFGYSVGGPIIKDKLFFFNNIEWIRVRSAQERRYLVPTPDFIAAADPATQAFFNAYGTLAAPIGRVYTKAELTTPGSGLGAGTVGTPWGNLASTFPVLGEVTRTIPIDAGGGDPQNSILGTARFDYNLSQSTQMFARYNAERATAFQGSNSNSPYAGYNTGYYNRNHNALLSVTHTFAPTVVFQSKVIFNRLKNFQPVNGPDVPTLFWKNTSANILGKRAWLPGYLPGSPGSGIPFGGPQNLYQFYEDLSWVKGNHQFRFGGNYIHMRDNRKFGAYEMAPEQLGGNTTAGFNNFLLGRLVSFRSAINPQGANACAYDYTAHAYIKDASCAITLPATTPKFGRNNRFNDWALYGNDSWKVFPRLTLNLGLRYEVYGVQHSADPLLDANFYFGPGSSFFQQYRNGGTQRAVQTPVHGLWEPDYNNFAPRLGFAWDVFGDGKTSLRGGFGIAYERNFGNVTFNAIQNPPNYAVISITPSDVGGVLPVYTANLGPFAGSGVTKYLTTSPSVRHILQDIRTAYSEMWNMSLERQLMSNTVLAFEYTGSHGVKLYSLEDPNRLGSGVIYLGDDPAVDPFERMNMRYGIGSFNRANRGFSGYNGLNVRFQSTNLWKSGLSITTNYTWSHAVDNLSSTFSDSSYNYNTGLLDPFNPKLDRGNADFDVRHRFVFSGLWQEPFFKNANGFVKNTLGGWELAPIITAQSGSPFTIFDCTNGVFYCPRAFATGVSTTTGRGTSTGANEYQYLTLPADIGTYANPLVGTSEFGNCTTPGQGAIAPCPWPSNMLGRNSFRTPNNWNVNLGIYKNFGLTEKLKLQVRGEMYNLFNHANDYIDNSTIDVSSSSDPTGTNGLVMVKKYDKRDVQLGLKFIF